MRCIGSGFGFAPPNIEPAAPAALGKNAIVIAS
jgi:hypothetical protein